MYRRLLVSRQHSTLWNIIYGLGWICVAFYTAVTLAKVCQCQPITKAWKIDMQGHCLNAALLMEISGMFNVVSDLAILLVPIHAIWELPLTLRKKASLCAMFSFGAMYGFIDLDSNGNSCSRGQGNYSEWSWNCYTSQSFEIDRSHLYYDVSFGVRVRFERCVFALHAIQRHD